MELLEPNLFRSSETDVAYRGLLVMSVCKTCFVSPLKVESDICQGLLVLCSVFGTHFQISFLSELLHCDPCLKDVAELHRKNKTLTAKFPFR